MKNITTLWEWFDLLQNKSFQLPIASVKKNLAVFLTIFLSFSIVSTIKAATFTVNTTDDNESNSCSAGSCTLREAINDANFTAESDTIEFESGLTGTIILNGTYLLITSDITINGPGARNLAVSANNASRVFLVYGAGGAAAISGLTITGGNAQPILLGGTLTGDGGGIINADGGRLDLKSVHVTGNSAVGRGGGIATSAGLKAATRTFIADSLIVGNTAEDGGGGIDNATTTSNVNSAVTTATNTTITGNSSPAEGGGIINIGGTLNLINCTIAENSSVLTGGAVFNESEGSGSGIVNARNSIFAFNNPTVVNGTLTFSDDVSGVFNSMGNNVVGNNANAEDSFQASIFFGGTPIPNANGDLVGSVSGVTAIIDPLLGRLQDNGGTTDTRSLVSGSPALDHGNNCVFTDTCSDDPQPDTLPAALVYDQRGTGFERLSNSTVDIGAYERFVAPAPEVSISGATLDPNNNPIAGVTVTLSDIFGNTQSVTTGSNGAFTFSGVTIGETYTLSAAHPSYTFTAVELFVVKDIPNLILYGTPNETKGDTDRK